MNPFDAIRDSWPEDDPRGVPLSVIGTRDQNGQPVVDFEDAHGIAFSVPREWVKAPVEEAREGGMVPHSVIDAPPGELERIWSTAAREGYLEQGGDESKYDGATPLDVWEDNIRGNPDYKGPPVQIESKPVPDLMTMLNAKQAPRAPAPEPSASGITGWRPKVAPPPPPTMRKQDIPPDAGAGWGEWDQQWDPRAQRWVKGRP